VTDLFQPAALGIVTRYTDHWGYTTVYPPEDKLGVSVDLVAMER
jgi:hypothetical protein